MYAIVENKPHKGVVKVIGDIGYLANVQPINGIPSNIEHKKDLIFIQKEEVMELQKAMIRIAELEQSNILLKEENEKLTKETAEFLEELEKTVVEIEKLDWWGKITKYGKLIWDMYLVVKKRIDAKKK